MRPSVRSGSLNFSNRKRRTASDRYEIAFFYFIPENRHAHGGIRGMADVGPFSLVGADNLVTFWSSNGHLGEASFRRVPSH